MLDTKSVLDTGHNDKSTLIVTQDDLTQDDLLLVLRLVCCFW